MLINSITSSLAGMRRHIDLPDEHAMKLQDTEDVDLSGEAVGMIVAQRGFEANADVLRISLDMQRTIVDILA